MILSDFYNPRKTKVLFGLKTEFNFFKDLIIKNNLPKINLLSGTKGIGKSTLVFHLMNSYFDPENYDLFNNKILKESNFYVNFINDTFSNIIYLDGSILENIKIEKIRQLKDILYKSPLYNKKRFIIIDGIEKFNINSLNALLKIIEEPTNNNYFFLINNKTELLLETIKSRCIEFKILITENNRKKNISLLSDYYNQQITLDEDLVKTSPGNFIKFNFILKENNIKNDKDFIKNLSLILNLYKKEKNIFLKDLVLYFTEYYLQKMKIKNIYDNKKIIENRSFMIKHLNNFFIYNLNLNTFLNSLEGKFTNE